MAVKYKKNQQKELFDGMIQLAKKAWQLGLDEMRWKQLAEEAWQTGRVEPADVALAEGSVEDREGERR